MKKVGKLLTGAALVFAAASAAIAGDCAYVEKVQFDGRNSTDLGIKLTNLEFKLSEIKLLSSDERKTIEDSINRIKRFITNINERLNKASTENKRNELNAKLIKANSSLKNYENQIDNDDLNIALTKDLQTQIEKLKEKIIAVKNDEILNHKEKNSWIYLLI